MTKPYNTAALRLITGLLTSLIMLPALAQTPSQDNPACLDAAKPNASTSDCSIQLIPLIEAKTENEFRRLADKFKENKAMLDTLQITKRSWGDYRHNQCTLESMAASNPQKNSASDHSGMNPTFKPLSPEANKAYLKCVLRTFEEMKTSLSKF